LYDYWDKYKEENTEAEEDPAESCGDVRAESFDKMEFGVRTKRPLEFEEGKYALLEEELKFLYCAITRARINVWIIGEYLVVI
jgi:ATP-dependent exoDNAse (exonuclease V) beta subunit